jgi:hypothetical protein
MPKPVPHVNTVLVDRRGERFSFLAGRSADIAAVITAMLELAATLN